MSRRVRKSASYISTQTKYYDLAELRRMSLAELRSCADLLKTLRDWSATKQLRCHMPGHNGISLLKNSELPWALDATELAATDDLHNPTHVIFAMQELASRLLGVEDVKFFTGGCSAALLTAIYATVKTGEDVLVAESSHRSIHHGLELARANKVIIPETDYCGIKLPSTLRDVQQVWTPKIRACILTTPTYEGLIADDLAETIAWLQARDCLVILDAAHGAHLELTHLDLPKVRFTADIVVHSLHKTLPAPTGTAILYCNSNRISISQLSHAYQIFEGSSPSYWLLAGISSCLQWLSLPLVEKNSSEIQHAFTDWLVVAQNMRNVLGKHYPLLNVPNHFLQDPCKILINTGKGKELAELLHRAGFDAEYAHEAGVLLLIGVGTAYRLRNLSDWEDRLPEWHACEPTTQSAPGVPLS